MHKLTVFFESPFWVGLYERENDGKYEVCKITFGGEPKDSEIYQFFLENNWRDFKFSPAIEAASIKEKKTNPKRIQRTIKRQVQSAGAGTKAQQALKLQQEQGKIQRKARSKAQQETEEERKFELRQEKRKAKHRGR